MIWLISSLVALAPFAVWGLRAYLASLNLAKTIAERKAGSDASQVEANNAEINRVENSARAGAAVDGLHDNKPDPDDLDGK